MTCLKGTAYLRVSLSPDVAVIGPPSPQAKVAVVNNVVKCPR